MDNRINSKAGDIRAKRGRLTKYDLRSLIGWYTYAVGVGVGIEDSLPKVNQADAHVVQGRKTKASGLETKKECIVNNPTS